MNQEEVEFDGYVFDPLYEVFKRDLDKCADDDIVLEYPIVVRPEPEMDEELRMAHAVMGWMYPLLLEVPAGTNLKFEIRIKVVR